MKKSLSLLLSGAMVFGLFASAVSAAETTELTTQQKFEALKAKNIFAGLADGSAGLDQEMTRAQAARIIALLKGLEGIGVPDTRVVTEKPFPDVELNQWFVEEVDAVKEDGSFKGNADGTFNPNGNLSVQELAVAVAAALGFDAAAADPVEVEGAASWAGSSIKYLEDNGYVVPTNYTEPATRGQLVEATYVANNILNPVEPAKVSVVSAKASGVKKVSVTLDKAVDTEKATLTLKRNNSTVSTKTVWADDKKSATLELDTSKIMEGDYTVTLAGLEEDAMATKTATFKGENEKVVKLEFVAPSDYLPQAPKVSVQFQAVNQYGDPVSIAAGNFNAYSTTGSANVKKDANGNLYVEIATNDPKLNPNVSQISINVVNTDSQITINKIFTLGSKPYVAKVELGKITYSNGEDYLSKSGDKAVIELIQLDQYGHRITDESDALFNATGTIIPYLTEFDEVEIVDDNDDKIRDVVVKLNANAKSTGDYTVSVFGGVSASTTVKVKATNYAATIELDTSKVLAEGDDNKYIPIIAYDKDGNKLSVQDIVDNYQEGHFQITTSANLGLITSTTDPDYSPTLAGNKEDVVPAATSNQFAVAKSGEHKGKLFIDSVGAKGLANIFINITPSSANGIMFNKNYQINIQEKRYPVGLKIKDDNAPKAIPAGGNVSSKLKVVAVDQYGEDYNLTVDEIRENTRSVTYDVYVEEITNVAGVTLESASDGTGSPIAPGHTTTLSNVLNKDWHFIAPNGVTSGEYKVKIALRKIGWKSGAADPSDVIDDEVASVTRGMKVIPTNTKLTYTVKNIAPLFAAIDNPAMSDDDGNPANGLKYDDAATSKHASTIEVEAKDNSGDKVALPANYVIGVSSSDSKVVDTDTVRKIIGNKAGTAQLAITHRNVDGSTNTVFKEVTVKDDTISVAEFSGGKAERNDYAEADFVGKNLAQVMNLEVKDNYGKTYNDPDIEEYDKLLGIRYSISDIDGISITVDAKGNIIAFSGTGSFTVTASAPNGKTRVTAVVVSL